ncbi:retrovirus-related pol polyprotein from transposon TNT 1-94, partial [Tanacetum coccineum]
ELIHYCLQNPPYTYQWAEKTVPVAEGSSETTTERYMENYKNVSQDIRDQLNAEAEAVQIILTGIDNDIYSTVNACPNACEMWKAIERLKQDESINVQDLNNLFWELEIHITGLNKMIGRMIHDDELKNILDAHYMYMAQIHEVTPDLVTILDQSLMMSQCIRDGENLDKMKEKGDACIFVGYSTQLKAYRVFNKRTRMIVETIHVNFDELPQMASDHVSSDPDEFITSSSTSVQEHRENRLSCWIRQNMHTFIQHHPPLLHKLDKDHPLEQVSWKSSQSVRTRRSARNRWRDVKQSDEENTVIRNKSRLVAKGYAQRKELILKSHLHQLLGWKLYDCSMLWMYTFIHSVPNDVKNSILTELEGKKSKYAQEILKKHGMTSCDSIGTPMATKHLDADLSGTPVNQTKYRGMVRALIENDEKKHLTAVKRIFRYLKDSINMGLWYPKDTGFELTAFSDSDHAGCLDSRKSTSGGIQFLGGDNFYDEDYQLTDYGFHFDKIPMYCDSKAAIAISCNPVQHSRTKHIDVRYHFIKEQVEKGIVELFFVGTELTLADLFTKALSKIGLSILSDDSLFIYSMIMMMFGKPGKRGIVECLLDIQMNMLHSEVTITTRKIHESVNVNFDEISEMASKQFSLEPGLSNLNKTKKSSNPTTSQVLEISKIDLEDLFHNFYDEYFDSSKITKSLTTNVETSNDKISSHEEVFHESSESFQEESSHLLLNDEFNQSSEEVMGFPTITQINLNIMVPNVNEAHCESVDWVSAMQDEACSICKIESLEISPRPKGKTMINTKWIFKNKKDERSLVIRNKAGLCVGFVNKEGYCYVKTFCSSFLELRLYSYFLHMLLRKDSRSFKWDVKTAFLK